MIYEDILVTVNILLYKHLKLQHRTHTCCVMVSFSIWHKEHEDWQTNLQSKCKFNEVMEAVTLF